VRHARKLADNVAMNCNFNDVVKVVEREGRGAIERADVHLDGNQPCHENSRKYRLDLLIHARA